MSENTFTSITNDSNETSESALRQLNLKQLIWIQFDQPIRPLKLSPAIECVFGSIAHDCEQLHGLKTEGLAITYARSDNEHFPSNYRFPLFISWDGHDVGPSFLQMKLIVQRTILKLRSSDESTIFGLLTCRLASESKGITNVIEVFNPKVVERHGIALSTANLQSLRRLCIHEAGHTAIARHYGHCAYWCIRPTSAVENGDWIVWDGATHVHSDVASRSQSVSIGLSGVVAECLWDDPDLDAYEIDRLIRTRTIHMSSSDEADSRGYSTQDMKDAVGLVRRHMPSILREANWQMGLYEDPDSYEAAA